MKSPRLLLLALAWSTAPIYAGSHAPAHVVDLGEYTHAHQLVDVDHGRRLNVFCMGSGSPTVIFEAGGGDDSSAFRSVEPGIAATARTCAYDRAGVGFSDAAARSS